MPLSENAARSKDLGGTISLHMQHRHFAFIAAVIRSMPTPECRTEAMMQFCKSLRRCNDRFDAGRFNEACQRGGVEQWTDQELRLACSHAALWHGHLCTELEERKLI